MKINGTIIIPVDDQEYMKKMCEEVENIIKDDPPPISKMEESIQNSIHIMDRVRAHYNIKSDKYISLGIFNNEYGMIVFNTISDTIHQELKRFDIIRCKSMEIRGLTK